MKTYTMVICDECLEYAGRESPDFEGRICETDHCVFRLTDIRAPGAWGDRISDCLVAEDGPLHVDPELLRSVKDWQLPGEWVGRSDAPRQPLVVLYDRLLSSPGSTWSFPVEHADRIIGMRPGRVWDATLSMKLDSIARSRGDRVEFVTGRHGFDYWVSAVVNPIPARSRSRWVRIDLERAAWTLLTIGFIAWIWS